MGLSLGLNQTQAQAQGWVLQNNLTFPVIYDSTQGEVFGLFTVATPYCVVIDDYQIMQYSEVSILDTTEMILDTLVQNLFVPVIGSSTTSIDFGQITVGQTASVELYIDNTRTGVLEVDSAIVNNPSFNVVFTPGEVYARDDSMLVEVEFSPLSSGNITDTLQIYSNGGVLQIPLSGTGTGSAVENPLSPVITDFTLFPAFPNPFNAQAEIKYFLPYSANVTLTVFDLQGKNIAEVYSGQRSQGQHSAVFHAEGLPSSIYYLQMEAGNFKTAQKIILLK